MLFRSFDAPITMIEDAVAWAVANTNDPAMHDTVDPYGHTKKLFTTLAGLTNPVVTVADAMARGIEELADEVAQANALGNIPDYSLDKEVTALFDLIDVGRSQPPGHQSLLGAVGMAVVETMMTWTVLPFRREYMTDPSFVPTLEKFILNLPVSGQTPQGYLLTCAAERASGLPPQ